MKPEFNRKTLLPFILTALVIIADQITKALVIKFIPLEYANGSLGIGPSFFGGLIRFINIRNPGVAFSMGESMPLILRIILFRIVPLIVIALVVAVYFRNRDFTQLQRWAIAGIVGGGLGNLIDRFFRSTGVVDFIDCAWFGLEKCPLKILQMTRWPTFNVADAAVVVCGIILIISFVIVISKEEKNKKNEKGEAR